MTEHESTSPQATSSGPTFAMLCCANGAEQVVKQAIAEQGWRLAFSRPGFVTAKHDEQADLPADTFIRTASFSIGHLKDADGEAQLSALVELLAAKFPDRRPLDQVHVWPRDRVPIGKFGFEPGVDEVSALVGQRIHETLTPNWVRCGGPNQIAEPGERVLDIVLVDPANWFVGWHTAADWHSRWPGGVQPIRPLYEPISRAYFKAAESITWSGFEIAPGDTAIEIGSAPGGACGRLLELGLKVIGIDPAEMDPRIADHPRFKHLRARAGDLPRKEFRGAKWLLADSNVKPEKTLTTIENIVTHQSCTLAGLLLTMKLGDYDAAAGIPRWIERMETWDPVSLKVRQLARNRCEVCFAVRLR